MPWCPKCKTEYREGFRVCADCGSELVEKLAEETAGEEFGEPSELEAGNLFDEESLGKMPAEGEQEGCIKTAQSGPATTGRRPGCCWGLEQWG